MVGIMHIYSISPAEKIELESQSRKIQARNVMQKGMLAESCELDTSTFGDYV
jgi:hypothetical protein